MTSAESSTHTDLLVVGAGIVGLAHAFEAAGRDLTVRVIERDERPVGASVRNFGHVCTTPQADGDHPLALDSRDGWLAMSAATGIAVARAGTLVVARRPEELAVLDELQRTRGPERVRLLTGDQVRSRIRGTRAAGGESASGGALLPDDLSVDPRTAAPALARWLSAHERVHLLTRTAVTGAGGGRVETPRGTFTADHVVVCVGHDLDRLFPDLARRWRIRRCALQMMLTAPVDGYDNPSPVLTGTSMLRYGAMSATDAAGALRRAIAAEQPELLHIDANAMFSRRPDGGLIVGDSHVRAHTVDPFLDEDVYGPLVDSAADILRPTTPLRVRQRWQGVYASSDDTNLVHERLDDATTVAVVTSGIGMTLSFGIARRTLAEL
ncbi:TIGR03364 family FAD-dependent oxidoreductase [Tomitella fengzijianii]|uniref:TIGR03364 family FAD-dependent oxidoreductase n=1 Tax=Tomitella fengzijianii TaxID=2597660 RepID=UPI001E4C055E|nr:TIGR03364 family FAD-dependent oxidoreductase [Tomitella fengzijianii]